MEVKTRNPKLVEVGARIREMREISGYSIGDMAQLTEVSVQEAEPDCEELRPRYAPLSLNVPSERLDAIVAGFTGLSREKAAGLFPAEKVFVNSRPVLHRDARLKAGDILSVRGFGKAVYDGVERESRKGRLVLSLRKYV